MAWTRWAPWRRACFAAYLIGTIIDTVGTQFNIDFLTRTVATLGTGDHALSYTVGGLASAMSGPAMAIAIGYALQAPPLVLFSLATVGFAANTLGGAGGPLAVLFVAILAAELGKLVSKETKVDILVTPLVTIAIGVGLSAWWAPAIGTAASSVGQLIMWATELQPLLMGILVSVIVGIALTLPISSAAICAALSLTGLAGGAAVAGCCAQMVGFAVMSFRGKTVGAVWCLRVWAHLCCKWGTLYGILAFGFRPFSHRLLPADCHLRFPAGDERITSILW